MKNKTTQWITIGAGIGMIFGAALDSIGVGLVIGAAIGLTYAKVTNK
ncbi:MAG: hypothetical protein L0Y35_04260 [Flammeovirgaceae bacterium]|nr:hypothetical protein [Flammeovirgaceae bacterium]